MQLVFLPVTALMSPQLQTKIDFTMESRGILSFLGWINSVLVEATRRPWNWPQFLLPSLSNRMYFVVHFIIGAVFRKLLLTYWFYRMLFAILIICYPISGANLQKWMQLNESAYERAVGRYLFDKTIRQYLRCYTQTAHKSGKSLR